MSLKRIAKILERHFSVIETVYITGRTPFPLSKKLNPLWWLVGPDGWNVPEINNGVPYLPEVKSKLLRRFYWFFCRNPLMNFVGYVIGIEDRNYSVTGTAPVLRTTGRDCEPQQLGWRWAILRSGWLVLPFVSCWNGHMEFYLGWRPASGGFGFKLVFPR